VKKNYYEILGVRENASKEEIRSAYRELVKKYHPDKYMDNPLADLAEEKLKEINEAYDYLMNNAHQETYTSYQEPSNQRKSYHNYQRGNEDFQRVRSYIRMGNYDAAFSLLQTLERNNAEWYFLSGLVSLGKGWYQQASDQIQTAMRMSPGNPEYINVWNDMNERIYHYHGAARQKGYQQNNNLCQLCTCLYCSDCCCECCGGDLIECC
jgi:molecular chaperone DnaJ